MVVKKLEGVAASDPAKAGPFVLVAESGANMLRAFMAIRDRLDFVAAQLGEPH